MGHIKRYLNNIKNRRGKQMESVCVGKRLMMKRYRFYVLTLLVMLLFFPFMGLQAKGQEEKTQVFDRETYERMETEYEERLCDMLDRKGYSNAGITMTKVIRTDGSRIYTVLIHHKRIDRLDDAEKQILLNELGSVSFGDGQCSILHKFLTYEG